MMEQDQKIIDLEAKITRLESTVENLSQAVFKNISSSSQIFTKDAVFESRMRLPVYTTAPSVAEVGDMISYTDGGGDGQVYVCTVAGDVSTPATFAKVGTQS